MKLAPAHFYLAGDFNNWNPRDDTYRFSEVTFDYGMEGRVLFTGSFTLTCEMPPGQFAFKIVQDSDWNRQLSVMPETHDPDGGEDPPYDISRAQFSTRFGPRPSVIQFRGGGTPPHALANSPGGVLRFDFHPASSTLAIHGEMERAPGPNIFPWKAFNCGKGLSFDTFVCLPWSFSADDSNRYPLCIFFDGRGLIYGEDHNFGIWNDRRRQLWRPFDDLLRHGVIAPPVIVAAGVPHIGDDYFRNEAYLRLDPEWIGEHYRRTIMEQMLPAIDIEFPVSSAPEDRTLLGHSNGGYMALSILSEYHDKFRGAMALSPNMTGKWLSDLKGLEISDSLRNKRIGITYSQADLSTRFVVDLASLKFDLDALRIPNLVQYIPAATHDPSSIFEHLHAIVSFVQR